MKTFDQFLSEKSYDPVLAGWRINLGGGATKGSWKPDEEEEARAALEKVKEDPKNKNATLFAFDQKQNTINAKTLASMKKKVSK